MLTKQKSRPLCQHCNIVPAKFNGVSKLGFKKYHKYCVDCSKMLYSESYKHLQYRNKKCDDCGFKPIDNCQLDLVYKDGNSKNKRSNNVKTLCANCNRLYKKQLRKKKKSVLNVTVDSDIRIG